MPSKWGGAEDSGRGGGVWRGVVSGARAWLGLWWPRGRVYVLRRSRMLSHASGGV